MPCKRCVLAYSNICVAGILTLSLSCLQAAQQAGILGTTSNTVVPQQVQSPVPVRLIQFHAQAQQVFPAPGNTAAAAQDQSNHHNSNEDAKQQQRQQQQQPLAPQLIGISSTSMSALNVPQASASEPSHRLPVEETVAVASLQFSGQLQQGQVKPMLQEAWPHPFLSWPGQDLQPILPDVSSSAAIATAASTHPAQSNPIVPALIVAPKPPVSSWSSVVVGNQPAGLASLGASAAHQTASARAVNAEAGPLKTSTSESLAEPAHEEPNKR